MTEEEFYKGKIAEMVEEIKDRDCLAKIYHYIFVKYKREVENVHEQS